MSTRRIGDLIERNLSRPIEEIIKVDQADEQSVHVEITEYVATDRLREQYRSVLKAMAEYPSDPHEGVGVWISGFFGSGKSSFAKNLGYVLANKPVLGTPAADLFKAQLKDPAIAALVENINRRIPTEVVMFDINADRQMATPGHTSLSHYMYRALLRTLDYAEDFDIAELEQTLEADGRLPDFVERFERHHREIFEKEGKTKQIEREQWRWPVRRKMAQKLNEASAILSEMDKKTYPQADSWARAQGDKHFELTPAVLAEKVFQLGAVRRRDKAIVFILDEVGSYVARNAERIEDLRAVVEQLGKVSKNRMKQRGAVGPVWVLVTSQEKLEDVVGAIDGKRVEIARVQDRFKYRVDLAPADIREVATRRILAKKPNAAKVLRELFAANEGQLNSYLKLERSGRGAPLSAEVFTEFYPYPPHFVDLSIDIMSGIRLAPGGMRQLGGSNRTIIKQAHAMLVSERTNLAEAEVGRLVTLDLVFELVEGNLSSEKQKDISDVVARFGAASWEARVAKVISLLEFVRDLPRTEANLAAMLYDRVNAVSPIVQVRAALESLRAAQFVRNTEDGYKLQTQSEKNWQTERHGLDPKPRQRAEARREAVHEVLKDRNLRSYNCKGLRTFRVGVTVDDVKLEPGDVPLEVVVAEEAAELAARCADVQAKSRRKEHANEVFWVFASTPAIEDLAIELCRSQEMVTKYEQLRGQTKITNEEAACLVSEKEEVQRLSSRLREQAAQALQGGTGFFRGVSKDGSALGRGHVEVLRGLFDVTVPDLYEKLPLGARPLTGNEAQELLKAANLSGLPQVLYEGEQGLGLVTKEGSAGKYVPNPGAPVAREILDFVKRKTAYGEKVSGRDLEQAFTGMPYGWERDLLLLVLAVLFRAGAVEVTHQGRRFRSYQDAQARVPLGSVNAFKAASFSPRESVGLKTLTTAAEYLEEIAGEEVEIEEGAIAQAFKKLAAEEHAALLPVMAKAEAYELAVVAALGEQEAALRGAMEAATDDCVRTLAGEGRSFKEAIERTRRIRDALEGPALGELRSARSALEQLWPIVRARSADAGLHEAAERLEELIASPSFYESGQALAALTGKLQQAYGAIYDEVHRRRQEVVHRESDLVKNRPDWEGAAVEVRDPLLAPLSSRSCPQEEKPRREAGAAVCADCRATVPQMESDILAAPTLRAEAVAKLQETAAPRQRVERVRMADLCPEPLDSEKAVRRFVEDLTSQLLKLLAEGKSILVE